MKHTPGPWSINGNKIDGNGYHIASINSHATTEGRANARLISAAPELLKVLQEIVKINTPLPFGLLEQAISSISKATNA